MFKKTLLTLSLALAAAAPQMAKACDAGHYVTQTQVVRQWVPERVERYQVNEFVPGRCWTETQTVVVSPGCWVIDCGRRVWRPPVTQTIQVQRSSPGSYQLVWKTRTVPGYYENVPQSTRVWVSDCHCHSRPRVEVQVGGHGHYHGSPRYAPQPAPRHGSNVVVTVPAPTARSLGREVERSSGKVGREVERTGRRIGREIRRIFD